MASHLGLGI